MKIYKVYEQFNDGEAYATEAGVIKIANNDRSKEDGTEAEEFKSFEEAKQFLEEEKGLTTEGTEFNSLEEAEAYLDKEGRDFMDKDDEGTYIVYY